MPKISISEASRRTGKPRSTLHRHIKTGKLSKEFDELGNPVIDMSELERAYGPLLSPDMKHDGATLQSAPGNQTVLDIEVQIELEVLRRENALLRDERDDLRRRLDAEAEERRRLTALLTDQRSKKPRSWWPWGKN
jgi:hypothetical protein